MHAIAITGIHSFLASNILQRLSLLPQVHEIHAFDIKPPVKNFAKMIFHKVDLTQDNASQEMGQIMTKHQVDTLIHGALFSGPHRRYSREVESIGTYHVLNACALSQVQKCVTLSSTLVYGAQPKNPNYLQEDTQLLATSPTFVRTRIDVEKQIQNFTKSYPKTQMTILRFAPIVGPNASSVLARYFNAELMPKVLGYDPLLQFIHEEDAIDGAMTFIGKNFPGTFNIVGQGVIALSTAAHMSGRILLPVPSPLCRLAFQAGFKSGFWDLSSAMLPFFQYVCVASGNKAKNVAGFSAKYSSRQALKSMLESLHLKKGGFVHNVQQLGEEQALLEVSGFERVK